MSASGERARLFVALELPGEVRGSAGAVARRGGGRGTGAATGGRREPPCDAVLPGIGRGGGGGRGRGRMWGCPRDACGVAERSSRYLAASAAPGRAGRGAVRRRGTAGRRAGGVVGGARRGRLVRAREAAVSRARDGCAGGEGGSRATGSELPVFSSELSFTGSTVTLFRSRLSAAGLGMRGWRRSKRQRPIEERDGAGLGAARGCITRQPRRFGPRRVVWNTA